MLSLRRDSRFRFKRQCRASDWVRRDEAKAVSAVIRVYVEADNMIETHEHQGEFKEWWQD